MSKVPSYRTSQYGSVKNFEAWLGTPTQPKQLLSKWGVSKDLGYRKDSLLVSSGHKAPYSRNIYNGGDFLTTRAEQLVSPGSVAGYFQHAAQSGYYNEGLLFPLATPFVSMGFPSWTAIRSVMVPLGSKGWNRFRPGKPVASLAQFLGELRQLPKNPFRLAAATHRAMRSAASRGKPGEAVDVLRRAVGEQYLNYSFGWRPFLNDLEKIANFDENLVAAMRQLRRDHGATIRRGGTIESDHTVSSEVASQAGGGYLEFPYWSLSSGSSARTITTTVKWRAWFSAGFIYRLPREDDPTSMNRLRTYLAGGGISPSLVWELTPWSWLADYFTNIGDVLENWEASRELSLAAKYCYVMYEKETTTLSEHTGFLTNPNYGSWNGSATFKATTRLRARTAASAYGFGFTAGSLSDSQNANLIALGLSRRV